MNALWMNYADDLVGAYNGFDPFQIVILMSYLWKLGCQIISSC